MGVEKFKGSSSLQPPVALKKLATFAAAAAAPVVESRRRCWLYSSLEGSHNL